jgi:hypothetical protein
LCRCLQPLYQLCIPLHVLDQPILWWRILWQ